jgi:UDPglucose--hexose-1-phosphate uridylyltransferase
MSELRRDCITGRWVIVSTDTRKRRADFHLEPVAAVASDPACSYCEGRESMTPPEIVSVRQDGTVPNAPGWAVRVVPHRAPMLRIEGGLDPSVDGLAERMNGIGAHEVIVASPRHRDTLASLPAAAVEQVLWTCAERMRDLTRDRRFRAMVLFQDHGASAGALAGHMHLQLVALPLVPQEVALELQGAREHHAATARCVFCDVLQQELADLRRVVAENAEMVALAPWASRSPFETRIIPRRHLARFEDLPREALADLAAMLQILARRMHQALESPPYNLVVHSAPAGEPAGASYHWHVELVPKLTRTGGFEWATGLHVNPVAPEEAAQVLRDTRIDTGA